MPIGPRIVSADALPQSAAGQKLVGDELKKQTQRAAYTLLVVGIVQMTCGAVLGTMISKLPGQPPNMLVIVLIATFMVGAAFIGLYFWARTCRCRPPSSAWSSTARFW